VRKNSLVSFCCFFFAVFQGSAQYVNDIVCLVSLTTVCAFY